MVSVGSDKSHCGRIVEGLVNMINHNINNTMYVVIMMI
jgi:hypothetical protein